MNGTICLEKDRMNKTLESRNVLYSDCVCMDENETTFMEVSHG